MFFKCGKSSAEKDALTQAATLKASELAYWHKWFAWYPVSVDKGDGKCAWMHIIERRYLETWASRFTPGKVFKKDVIYRVAQQTK